MPGRSRAAVWGARLLIVLVLCGHAFGAHRRNELWGSDEALWHNVTVKSPRNGRGLMNYGLALMKRGEYDQALGYYERALALLPRYPYIHINMGIVKGAMDRPAEAERHFRDGLAFGPSNPEAHLYYGRWLRAEGRADEARVLLEKGLAFSPEHRGLRSQLEGLRSDARRADARLAYLSREAAENPSVDNYLNLSLAYYRAGRYRECIESCLSALEIEPDLAVAYNNMCSAYVQLAEYANAIGACTKALEIDPGFTRARSNLRWALESQRAADARASPAR